MSISKSTTDITTLKINYLTQEMYDAALANNQINENELYVTPNEPEFTVENNYEEILPLASIVFDLPASNGYSNIISSNPLNIFTYSTLIITFDNVKYICDRNYDAQLDIYSFGASYDSINELYDFSVYPFMLYPMYIGNTDIYTGGTVETEETYTLKIEALTSSTITTSSDFSAAVNHVIDSMKIEGGSY